MADSKKEVVRDDKEARITRLEALMRKVLKEVEVHFGKDLDGDGKQGSVRVWLLALLSVFTIGAVVANAAQNAETGDLWGDVDGGSIRIRSNGDVDSDGSFVGAGVSVSGTIGGVPSSGTVWTGLVGAVTASETYGTLNKTVLELADVQLVIPALPNNTNSPAGTKIYSFPIGNIYVLGFEVNDFEFKTNAACAVIDSADGGDFAFGTAVGSGTNDLTGTMIDLTDTMVSIDPITNIVDALTAFDDIGESRFDGTDTAKDVYVNILIDGADIAATATNTCDATVTITWINLGDN